MSKRRTRKKRNPQTIKKKTATGIFATGGELQRNEDDTIDWQLLQTDYEKIMNKTPILKPNAFLLTAPITASTPRILIGKSKSEKAKEAADYIEWNFDNLEKGYKYFLRHVTQGIFNGVQFFEKIPLRGDYYIITKKGIKTKKLTNRIQYFSPTQNNTISGFYYKNNEFIGIQHEKREDEGKFEIVEIKEGENGIQDINNILLWFSYKELYHDVRGQALLRPVRLFCTCVEKIIIGRTVNIQAGRGIPEVITQGKPGEKDKAELRKMAKNINALMGENFFMHEESVKVLLHEIKGQAGAQQFLEFLWKNIHLLFLTHFITIGMSQTGAYNAGEAQKSPYELAIQDIMSDIKDFMQKIVNYMIRISYLANIPEEDYPIFDFSAVQQSDLLKTSQIIVNLRNAGINFTLEEINSIKKLLPMLPDPEIITTEKKTELPEEDEIETDDLRMSRKIKPEILEFESMYFKHAEVNEHYLTQEEKATSIIQEMMRKILNEAKSQIKAGRKLKIGYKGEFHKKLLKLFNESYNKGEGDVKEEVKEISKTKKLKLKDNSLKLIAEKKIVDKQSKVLSITIDRLYNDIESKINYATTGMTEKQLDLFGGIYNYIDTLSDQFKGVYRDMMTEVISGYTLGRNETLDELTTDESVFLCSEILDKNLCDNCAVDDGLFFSKKEIEESKHLSLEGTSIHLNCLGLLGNNKCRGQWIIYE